MLMKKLIRKVMMSKSITKVLMEAGAGAGKTYSLVGTPSIVEMKDSTVTWSVAVTCNYNSPYIFVNITAEDSKTIEWFLDVDLTELVFTN